MSNAKVGSFDDLCVIWSNMASKTNLEICCAVVWAIGTVRNQWIHDGPKVSSMETLEKTGRYLENYQACCMAEYDPVVVSHKRNKQWIRSLGEKMKLSTDA
ncbi:hypothetical protein TIFTF001_023855 [Ficus carica]|uniref:Uncharacterized protein n=1 Tax=Ficus carica TaxID=3494 RepID=A0AA88DFM0_FICCA|nr:hypothetical protein TIFTF001_023855 [Ficus carica]